MNARPRNKMVLIHSAMEIVQLSTEAVSRGLACWDGVSKYYKVGI